MNKLSVVIAVKNGERDIRDCLESVKWVDEIVIVDEFSFDKTIEICEEYTNKIFQVVTGSIAGQKNFGIERTTGDWILSLDSDERTSSELVKEIKLKIDSTDFEGYRVRFKTYFLDRWIRHFGWFEYGEQIRLFKGKRYFTSVKYNARIVMEDKIGFLKEPIIHYSYHSLSEYFEKINRYTTYQAEDLFKMGVRIKPYTFFWYFFLKPVILTLRKYFLKGGYKEGIYGFLLSMFYFFFVFGIHAKLWEMQKDES